MKKNGLCALLLAGLLLTLTACGGGEIVEPSEWTGPGFELLSGTWANEDASAMLQINGDGQAWYIDDGDVLFRGYLEEVVLSEGDTGYEYYCRYDLYNDGGTLMFRYYNDPEEGLLLEENTQGEMVEQYEYEGGLETTPNAYAGNWYIQGVSDSYCLRMKLNDTWELRYPGLEGEVLCSGQSKEDPFGSYDLVIDEERNIDLGSVDREEGHLEMGVRTDAPCQLDPFLSYYFYPEEVSRPRISVGDYTGWWDITSLSGAIEILEGDIWTVYDPFGEDDVGGTCEVTDTGIILYVERSNSPYYIEGESMAFTAQDNSSLYDPNTTLELVPSYANPEEWN